MNKTNGSGAQSDALVLFGVTGDLAHKKIFPALYAMAKRGVFNVPVIGVATSKWSSEKLRQRATESIKKSGKIDDQNALDHLLSLLTYDSFFVSLPPGAFDAIQNICTFFGLAHGVF